MKYELMQIVFSQPGVAEYLSDGIFDTERLAPGEVVVRTAVSTVSPGTERANLIGESTVSIYGNESPFPRYLGYSSSGTVVAVGSKVNSVKVGDRVAVYDGYHVSYNVVDQSQVVMLPDGVSFETGAMGFIASFPMSAVRKTEIEPGDPVLVMGLGILGQLAVRFARLAGGMPVVAVDPVKERRELALSGGADYALDPTMQGFADEVRRLTGGGARACIEVTGVGAGLNQALDCMARFGRVALLGCTRNSDFSVDFYKKVHGPGIKIIGAHSASRPGTESTQHLWTIRDDIDAVMRLIAGGRVDLDGLIQETYLPESAQAVYGRLAYGKDFPVCVQFDWRGLEL